MSANVPVYCASDSCGVFVGDAEPSNTGEPLSDGGGDGSGIPTSFLTCPKCHMKTCTKRSCRQLQRHHLGIHAICPGILEDDGDGVKKIAEENGWRRCPSCWVLTEKKGGCDGIRCVCRAKWCYKCGKMQEGKDSCMCWVREYVDLVGAEGDGVADGNSNHVVDDADLPELAEIFGIGGRAESMSVVESIEVGEV